MTLLQLFILFARTALFTFGGGYAMIPLLSTSLVPTVLSSHEMANIVALAQMTPGAVGLNCATYVGFRGNGIFGSLVCTLGLISPCLIIATLVAMGRQAAQENRVFKACLHGIRPMVIGLIAYVVIFFANGSLCTGSLTSFWNPNAEPFGVQWRGIVIFLTVFLLERLLKLNTLWLISIAIVMGILLFLV